MMTTIPVVADLDIEKSILSKLILAMTESRLNSISTDKAENLVLALDTLNNTPVIDKPFVGKEKIKYFSLEIHQDIFDFIYAEFYKNKYPSPFEIKRHLQNLPRYRSIQANISATINNILDCWQGDITLEQMPLLELVTTLANNAKQREVNAYLQKGITSIEDIDNIKSLIEELESPSSTKEQLEIGIARYQQANSAVEKVLAKRSIRLQGYLPNEVADLTDNYVPPRPTPTLLSGSQFFAKDFSEATWIYPGIIKAGVVTLVTGQAGSGKTLFCIDAMLSYLEGKAFLGEEPSILAMRADKRGLILNADQPEIDAHEMLRGNPLAWKHQNRFDIISNWCLGDIGHLEMLLKEGTHDFIVIDSYKAIHSHLSDWDENKPSASAGIKELTKLCDKYGCTMLLIHHAGNTQEKGRHASRGHSSIADTASAVITIKSSNNDDGKGDPNVRFLDISKIRNSERNKLTLKFNPLIYGYEVLPDNQGLERQKVTTIANGMINQFPTTRKSNGELERLSEDAILNKISGGSRRELFTKVVQKLEQRGLIERTLDGNIFMFSLTDAGLSIKLGRTPNILSLKHRNNALSIKENELNDGECFYEF